jgi:tetratricopeptide (TPR) repeat protein
MRAAPAGDAHALHARAVEAFRNADQDLDWVARNAREERAAGEIAETRRELACAALAWETFRKLGGTEAAYTPSAAEAPSPDEIDAVLALLEEQRAAFFEDASRHVWLTYLFLETRGLLWRLRGDRLLREADKAFLAELQAAQAARDAGRAVVALYHLRRFEAAAQLAPLLADASGMAPERAVETLSCLHGALRFLGRDEAAGEVAAALRKLGGKAGQAENPVLAMRTFFTGRKAELAKAAETLSAAAGTWALQGRTRAMLHFAAASYAMGAGDHEAALPLFREARRAELDGYLGALLESAGGVCFESLGYYAEAAEAFGRARLLAAADPKFATAQLVNLVSALLGQNLRGEAEALLRRELAAAAAPESELWLRVLLGNVAFARRHDDPAALEDAEAIYARAEARLGDLPACEEREYLAALLQTNLGNAKHARAMAEGVPRLLGEAEACMRRALQAAPRGSRLAAVACANLAEILLDRGDRAQARERSSAALAAAETLGYPEVQWRARLYLGRIAEEAGDLAAAENEYAQAVQTVEVLRARLPTEEERTNSLRDKTAAYESLARVLLAAGAVERAFAVAERAKARSARESLGLRETLLALGPKDAAIAPFVRLMRRGDPAPGATRPFAEAASLDALRGELEALRARATAPAVVALFGAEPSPARTRAELDAGEMLLEYFPVGDRLAVWMLTRAGVAARVLPADWPALQRRALLFAAKKADDRALAEELGAALLEPLGALPEKLCIVPTGVLHRVPFEALRVRGAYLVELAETRYAPSAALAAAPAPPRAPAGPEDFLALANPDTDYDGDGRPDKPVLRGALVEVSAIGRHYAGAPVYHGKEATEALWRARAPEARVIHAACHGMFQGHDPWSSALFLATGGGEDGILQAWEVLATDLRNADLVTLSGCETGVSRVEPGDDIAGLPRGFLLAGARALVASLWPVEDQATARLMAQFYGGAARNQPLGAALRAARLALLRGKEFNSPRNWAPFVLFQRRGAPPAEETASAGKG